MNSCGTAAMRTHVPKAMIKDKVVANCTQFGLEVAAKMVAAHCGLQHTNAKGISFLLEVVHCARGRRRMW
jgi:predicted hotdog family 3-hydroxylacyl-ACP dehydratase